MHIPCIDHLYDASAMDPMCVLLLIMYYYRLGLLSTPSSKDTVFHKCIFPSWFCYSVLSASINKDNHVLHASMTHWIGNNTIFMIDELSANGDLKGHSGFIYLT